MKTLHIDPKIHENFKKYCKEKGYQINKLTEIIIDEYMKNNKKDDTNRKN